MLMILLDNNNVVAIVITMITEKTNKKVLTKYCQINNKKCCVATEDKFQIEDFRINFFFEHFCINCNGAG